MQLQLAGGSIDLSIPKVMGVLNVTPDSFSDGGRFVDFEAALAQAARMAEEGAGIIDVGGESTRPGAGPVTAQAEIDRVVPVIEAIAARLDVAISVDTGKPEVMRAAVRAGATLINDVYALRQDGALQEAARLGTAICLVHMQGEPRTMQKNPHYDDLLGEVTGFLAGRVRACIDAGIARDRMTVDPGFGFGKTDRHNFELLANLQRLHELELPLTVGLSRKSTFGRLTGRPVQERMAAGLAAAVLAVERGAHIVRTHDVGPTVDALQVARAVINAQCEDR